MKLEQHKEYFQNNKKKKVIGTKEIEDVISKVARIPAKNINKDDRNSLKTLRARFKSSYFWSG